MKTKAFDQYGRNANKQIADTVLAGRYSFQALDEKWIVQDIILKLELQPTDTLFEIGCGPGSLLVPLSFLVSKACGLDHPLLIDRIVTKFPGANLELFRTNFFDYRIEEEAYSKVLVYSVLHCLDSFDDVASFCIKALRAVKKGGLMLIGDIPNTDMKKRFLASDSGKEFHSRWIASSSDRRRLRARQADSAKSSRLPKGWEPNDAEIDRLAICLKAEGAQVFVLPQPRHLPFGNTRCDLLVRKS